MDVPGLHVDLAARLGHVEMDHGGQFCRTTAVRDERALDGLDTGRHGQRRAHVVLTQDPDPGHPRSLPSGCPPVNRQAGARPHGGASVGS